MAIAKYCHGDERSVGGSWWQFNCHLGISILETFGTDHPDWWMLAGMGWSWMGGRTPKRFWNLSQETTTSRNMTKKQVYRNRPWSNQISFILWKKKCQRNCQIRTGNFLIIFYLVADAYGNPSIDPAQLASMIMDFDGVLILNINGYTYIK